VFILVIPNYVDQGYLQSGDGTSQNSATIDAPINRYADYAAFALVNGELHIFGGWTDYYKVQFSLTNQYYEIIKNSIVKFQNNSQDCATGWLLFQRASGATQRRTKKRSRGTFDRKWSKR
jgi:hypothetical protein